MNRSFPVLAIFFPLINFRRGIAVEAVEKQAHREPRQREGGGPTGNGQERSFSGRLQFASSETTPFFSSWRKHRSMEGHLLPIIHLHCTDPWLTFKCANFSVLRPVLSLSHALATHWSLPGWDCRNASQLTSIIILVSSLLFQAASVSAVWKQCSRLPAPDQ